MLFSAAAPSMLFSSEKEEGDRKKLKFINKYKELELIDKDGEPKLDIELELLEVVPEKSGCNITTESGEKIFIHLSQPALKECMNRKLAHYALQTDEENCKKLLETNADPNWENENGDTPLDIASSKYLLDENQETCKVWQLLEKEANIREKELSFNEYLPLLLKFFHTPSKYQPNKNQETRKPRQLSQKANIRERQLSFNKYVPFLIEFFHTQN